MVKQVHKCRWIPMGEVLLKTMKDVALRQKDVSKRNAFLSDLASRAKEMKQQGIDIGEFDIHSLDDAIKAIDKGVI